MESCRRCSAALMDSGSGLVQTLRGSCPSLESGRRSSVALVLFLILSLSYLLLVSNLGQNAWTRIYLPPFKKAEPGSGPRTQWVDPGPYHVAYPRDYRFIMDDTAICRSSKPFVLLMVPVAPTEVNARNLIRGTWGRPVEFKGHLLQTLFFMGVRTGAGSEQMQENLRRENEQYHDIVQSDFIDSYHNLTIKTMMMIEWITAHCSTAATFVVKVDSDIFLHVPNLFALLLRPDTPRSTYMTGLVWWHSPVIRNPALRFFLPRWVIPEDEYPPYPLGMMYILSSDLPRQLLRASQDVRPIYIEDAYLGLCLRRLRLRPTEPPEKSMFLVDPRHPLNNCALSRVVGTVTDNKARMMSYWSRSQQPEAHC